MQARRALTQHSPCSTQLPQIKDVLSLYDRTLLVADPRRAEPKKWVAGRRPNAAGGSERRLPARLRAAGVLAPAALPRRRSDARRSRVLLNPCPPPQIPFARRFGGRGARARFQKSYR